VCVRSCQGRLCVDGPSMVNVADAVYRMSLLVNAMEKSALSPESKGVCNVWLTALCGFASDKHAAFTKSRTQHEFVAEVERLIGAVAFCDDDDKLESVRVAAASFVLNHDEHGRAPLAKVNRLWFGKLSVRSCLLIRCAWRQRVR